MRIIFVRHGESLASLKGIHSGQRVDIGLSKNGKMQARKLADKLKDEKIEAIYSSDLKRAMETAKEIAKMHDVRVILDKRLREFDSGDLGEMKNMFTFWREYRIKEAKRLRIKRWEVKAPGGESEQNHLDRVRKFIRDVEKRHKGTIIVVAHGGTNRIIFGVIKHVPKKKMYNLGQANTGVNIAEFDGKNYSVSKVNNMDHLEHDSNIIRMFNKIRDQPLHNPESLKDVDNSCWGKSRRLKKLFEKKGYKTRFVVCSFRWSKQKIPRKILSISHADKDYHLFLKVKIHGEYFLADASNDSKLPKYNLWDGKSDSKIAVKYDKIFSFEESPKFEEEERKSFPEKLRKNRKFYRALNKFFDKLRK